MNEFTENRKIKVNIVIVHSNELLARGIKNIFDSEEMFQHVSIKKNLEAITVSHGPNYNIDILLLDINLFLQTEEWVKKMKDQLPPKIIISSEKQDYYAAHQVAAAGVEGYILESTNIPSLKEAICHIMKGYNYYHPLVVNELFKNGEELVEAGHLTESEKAEPHPFTRRELQTLQFIGKGKDNFHISKELNISERTVRNHVASIFKKIRVDNRTQALVICAQKGWITI